MSAESADGKRNRLDPNLSRYFVETRSVRSFSWRGCCFGASSAIWRCQTQGPGSPVRARARLSSRCRAPTAENWDLITRKLETQERGEFEDRQVDVEIHARLSRSVTITLRAEVSVSRSHDRS